MSGSRVFEKLYQDLIPNYVSREAEDYQDPAMLYICGGNAEDNSSFQELVEWREKQGYIVYLIPESDAGSNANSIKSFLQDVMVDFDNPPEIVGLIGDTGGSYSIPYFTYDGGATDVEYSYLSGNDFLPEIFIPATLSSAKFTNEMPFSSERNSAPFSWVIISIEPKPSK